MLQKPATEREIWQHKNTFKTHDAPRARQPNRDTAGDDCT